MGDELRVRTSLAGSSGARELRTDLGRKSHMEVQFGTSGIGDPEAEGLADASASLIERPAVRVTSGNVGNPRYPRS